jgi:rhodanese-related sulfurtransferase
MGKAHSASYLLRPALLSLTLLLLAGYAALASGAADHVGPREAAKLMQENAENRNFVVVDVRTPGEFSRGHLNGALLVDYNSPDFRQEIARLDRTKTYLVYCRTGNRSTRAVAIMEELGFRNVYHMDGGIVQWEADGLPARP